MAFEALNHIGQLKSDIIIVLNDNERSIGETVGALSQYLTRIITTRTYNRFRDDLWKFFGRFPPYIRDRGRNLAKRIQEGLKGLYSPSVIFEELGIRYIGPLNGHKLDELIDTFSRIREMKGPRIVHVVTKKGKGYRFAEEHPERYHGIGPYDPRTGDEKQKVVSYTEVFGNTMVELAKKNARIVAISAGMCLGTGLKRFSEELPERFFDVGICEQHAVTMAASLALEGYIPVCAIYSTFLQRAFDQLIHDVALQKLPVIFAIDRAGLVGEDGPTHHGPFDITYLRCVPNMVIAAPKDGEELISLLKTAVNFRQGPFAIRYPRGASGDIKNPGAGQVPVGRWEVLEEGRDIVILATGSMVKHAREALPLLHKRAVFPSLVNARFIKPLDTALLNDLCRRTKRLVTIEENTLNGGFGSAIVEFCISHEQPVKISCLGLPDNFIEHGGRDVLLKAVRLDSTGIAAAIASL
jgi:1-deoxy-D-xylulose-5-phosphate synthase